MSVNKPIMHFLNKFLFLWSFLEERILFLIRIGRCTCLSGYTMRIIWLYSWGTNTILIFEILLLRVELQHLCSNDNNSLSHSTIPYNFHPCGTIDWIMNTAICRHLREVQGIWSPTLTIVFFSHSQKLQ